MINKKIGERIRQARVIANLSQDNVASELGISIGAYSNIERGKTEITVTRLWLIAKLLKISVTGLFEDTKSLTISNYPESKESNILQLNELKEELQALKKEVALLKKPTKKERY